jgi:hypothetical protein
MAKETKKTTQQVRIYPATNKRLKLRALKLGVPFAELVDKLSKKV